MGQSVRAAAEVAVARQKVKQAQDACRKASQRLAAARDLDIYTQLTCRTPDDIDRAVSVLALAVSEHPHGVDVVLITHPRPQ